MRSKCQEQYHKNPPGSAFHTHDLMNAMHRDCSRLTFTGGFWAGDQVTHPFHQLTPEWGLLPVIALSTLVAGRRRQGMARWREKLSAFIKAELEIRQLHEKMDHVLVHQWQRMVEIQQIQTELIDELVDWHQARSPRGW